MKASAFLSSVGLVALFGFSGQPVNRIPFDRPILFSYGTWEGQIKVESGKVVIDGKATPKGGGGVNVEMAAASGDLSPVIRVKTLPGNTLKGLRLILMDSKEAQGSFEFTLPEPGASRLVYPKEGASLAEPNSREKGNLDHTLIRQWQLGGDWGGDAPAKVEVESIEFMAPNSQIIELRKARAARLQAERDFTDQELAELRARYGKRSELSPTITKAWFFGSKDLTLEVVSGRIKKSALEPYKPLPGDQIVEDNNGQTKKLSRGGREVGFLIGPNREWLNPHEIFEGDPILNQHADDPKQFSLVSTDDPDFASPVVATNLGRKSKPIDAAMPSYEMVLQHRLYLSFPKSVKAGKSYTLKVGSLNTRQESIPVTFNPAKSWSEAVRVNQIGFRPDDPVKVAFLSLWKGTGGAARFGSPSFAVVDDATGKPVFEGKGVIALEAGGKETLYRKEGNYSQSEVTHLDFSPLKAPGRYRVVVEGVGSSDPFEIGPEVWTKAWKTQMRGLLNNRSGMKLGAPYTTFVKPRDMHPEDGQRVTWSSATVMDDGEDPVKLAAKDTSKPADGWGGYHDAGDWNPRRVTHLKVTMASLELMEMFPAKAASLKWNIPQELKAPDILNEAKWEIDVFRRLQQSDGGVSFGLETAADPLPGEVSWLQSMPIYAWSPDAYSSWVYVNAAFRFADLLKPFDAKTAAVYAKSALDAMNYAEADNARRVKEGKATAWQQIDARNLAALAAYRSTKDEKWHKVFLENSVLVQEKPNIFAWTVADQADAAFLYATLPKGLGREDLKKKAVTAIEEKAQMALDYQKGNAFRLSTSDPGKPMINGFFTTPHVQDIIRAHFLTGKAEYLKGVVAGSLFSAGANPVGTTFTTGVGTRSAMAFKIDSRETNQPMPEGLTIYGMCDYVTFGQGQNFYTWPIIWHVSKVAVPDPFTWPIQEALFETHLYPAQLEYTVDQWAPNVYTWGYLAMRR